MTAFIFHLISHTHWDREWYLPRAAFQARLVRVLDDVVERLMRDPAYRSFLLDGQTVLIEDYLRARPEREASVRTLVKTGRLALGPSYVLADEQIPSGEALVRNLLLGAADAERWGGRLDVLYSPDAFGHPAAWPSLARGFGIRYGVVWRGLGGEPGQERDWYRWRGPDGAEVLLWHLPPGGYEVGASLGADLDELRSTWPTVRRSVVERAASPHIPVLVGADHHAAHPDMARLRDLLAELEPESAFRVSRLDEFFQAAADAAAPVPLAGELRWSYRYTWTLQGVHATRAPLKRRYAAAELALERVAEPLAALARRAGGSDRRPLLDLAWRALVRCQFHDALAGCASDAVAQAVEGRLTSVEALAAEIVRTSVFELGGHDPDRARARERETPALVLWNPAARPRGGIVVVDVTFRRRQVGVGPPGDGKRREREGEAEGYRPFALVGAGERPIPVQVLDRRRVTERLDAVRHYPHLAEVDQVRIAFRSPTIPGLGLAVLSTAPASGGPQPRSRARAFVRARALVNPWLEVALAPSGALSVLDRRSGERFADVLRLEGEDDAGDTYSFCPTARARVVRARGPIRLRRLAAGPLVAALQAEFALLVGTQADGGNGAARRRGRVGVRLVVQLDADSPIVRCILELDNAARWHRLRARIPTNLAGARALAGTAFGAVRRAPVVVDPARYPLETPVSTAPAHRFVASAAGPRGLAVFAPGFFEYDWTAAGDLVLTLLRAVGELSRADLATRPGHAAWPLATPLAQCPGVSRVELALAPIAEPEVARGDVLPSLWEDAFLPVRGYWLRDAVAPLTPRPVEVTLEGSGLVLSTVKPAQQGSPVVLRCYNATDRRAAGAWVFGEGVRSAHRVRLDERESLALVLEGRGKTIRFTAEPHEIVTMLVT